jgi:hypothetical protein
MRVRTASATVSLILVGLGAAACSSASTGAGSSPNAGAGNVNASTKPAAASTAAAGGGTSATAAPKSFDTCGAMPAATASQITGTSFTSTKPDSTANVIFGCEYTGPNSSELEVSVTLTGGQVGYDADVNALTTAGYPPNPVSGVGDKAWSEPDPKGNAGSAGAAAFGAFGARYGDTYIQISGLTYVTADQGKQIAELLHSKL